MCGVGGGGSEGYAHFFQDIFLFMPDPKGGSNGMSNLRRVLSGMIGVDNLSKNFVQFAVLLRMRPCLNLLAHGNTEEYLVCDFEFFRQLTIVSHQRDGQAEHKNVQEEGNENDPKCRQNAET